MAAASSITTSSAWPSFTESAGCMYCREGQDMVIVNNCLSGNVSAGKAGALKSVCCPCSPWPSRQRLTHENSGESVHVTITLTRTVAHIWFCTFSHKFMCRDHENKGDLITRNRCSSFTVSFTFLHFWFKKPTSNDHGSFVIYRLCTGRGKVFWEKRSSLKQNQSEQLDIT